MCATHTTQRAFDELSSHTKSKKKEDEYVIFKRG